MYQINIIRLSWCVIWYRNQGGPSDRIVSHDICTTGYIITESVVDQGNRDEICIAFTKIAPDAPDISLLCVVARLIQRQYHHFVPSSSTLLPNAK
jgi:hypothetical protein